LFSRGRESTRPPLTEETVQHAVLPTNAVPKRWDADMAEIDPEDAALYRQIGTSFAVETVFAPGRSGASPDSHRSTPTHEKEADSAEYLIDSIVTHRANECGELEFKVHWTGTSSNDDEWFDREMVETEYPEMVRSYEAEIVRPQSRARRRREKKGQRPRTSGGESVESGGGADRWVCMQAQEEELMRAREAQARLEAQRQQRREQRMWREERARKKKQADDVQRQVAKTQREQGMEEFKQRSEGRREAESVALLAMAREAKLQQQKAQLGRSG
jgi:hypothetical protein